MSTPALPAEKLWFTDRSRYITGLGKCNYERYLAYHSGHAGIGVSRIRQSLPLATGIAFHLGVALIVQHKLPEGFSLDPLGEPWAVREEYRAIIQAVVSDYQESVNKTGLLEISPEETKYKAAEQACLVEGMLWGFIRGVLPRFLELFEVLEVEQEDLVQLTEADEKHKAVVLQLRPDFGLRRRETGKLVTADLKTAYRLDEKWEQQWEDNLQMAIQGLGFESQRGEEVAGYYILGVQKGFQDRAKVDGVQVGPRRQRSPFTYVYHLCTGLADSWQSQYEYVDDAGKTRRLSKDWRLEPVWEQPFPEVPGGVTNAEHWAWELPLSLIYDQFKLVGQFSRNAAIVEKFLAEAPYEEVRWQDRLQAIEEGVPAAEVIPRSWNCYGSWGKPCPYMPVCYDRVGWEQLYETRTPHHEAEATQAGIQVVRYEETEEDSE